MKKLMCRKCKIREIDKEHSNNYCFMCYLLKKSLSDKINISTINELLSGKNQSEIANNYGITQGRVSQIWGDFKNELVEKYNAGWTKEELIGGI